MSTTSPTTTCSAGICASAPSRRTRAVAFIIDFRAFMALSALPSCRRPTTAFSTVSNNSKTAVLHSLTSRDTTAAATRMICILLGEPAPARLRLLLRQRVRPVRAQQFTRPRSGQPNGRIDVQRRAHLVR